MALQTRYRLDPLVLEEGGGEILVETAGYVPADVRIREFIEAGIRLGEYRKEAYDFGAEDEVDFSEADPLRNKAVDMAEVSQLTMTVKERLRKTAMTVVPEKEEGKEEEAKEPKEGGDVGVQ